MTQEELKLALEELADRFSEGWHEGIKIDASDIMLLSKAAEALAQEQEPVIGTKTWFEDGKVVTQYLYPSDIYTTPPQPEQEPVAQYIGVYITPPQRTWVGLTEQQLNDIENDFWVVISKHVFDAIEAKLKQNNGYVEEKNT